MIEKKKRNLNANEKWLVDLGSNDPTERSSSVEKACVNAPLFVAQALARAATTDPDSIVRHSAAEALGEVGDQLHDLPRLFTLIKDHDLTVRCAAVSSLSQFPSTEAQRKLIAVMEKDRHPLVRRWASIALSDQEGVEKHLLNQALLKRLDLEESPIARIGVISALYRLDNSHPLTEMLQYLTFDRYEKKKQNQKVIESAKMALNDLMDILDFSTKESINDAIIGR